MGSLPSHGSPSSLQHRAFSTSHTYYRPPLGVFALHSLFLYSDTSHPLLPYFQLAQAIFEPNLYLHKYPSNLVPVILTAYSTYEYGRQCSETSAHEIQMPGNHPKEY
jgi:hypothetical protein